MFSRQAHRHSMLLPVLLSATLWFLAHGHMGVTPAKAVAGSRTIVGVRISHDCGDATVGTTNFTVVLPKLLPSVAVEMMPHWRTMIHKAVENVTTGNVTEPVEYVRAITYLGFLPDGFYQIFNLRIKFPDSVGDALWFKGYQDCHNQGTSLAWDMLPNATNPKPRYPARNITLVESLDECGH